MRLRSALLGTLIAESMLAQSQTGLSVTAPAAVRIPTSARIVVDGRPTEAVWALATPIDDFRQNDPDVGAPATERTEVRVLFDSTTLYISVRAFDANPDKVIARILARDQLMFVDPFAGQLNFASDDAIAILIDPFRDRRNAVVFATNPNGAEFDAQITDQGREVNVAWRTVWRVAATRTDSGWSAEFAIPLRSIRHPDDGRAWGFNVYRVIRRKNEQVLWRSWSRDNAGFLKVSEAGELQGIHGLAREGIGLEVKSSAIGRAVRGDVDGRRTPADGALDLKYELRPGVTLDATANTDFAQADVDDVQINLTRFDLFFPEKRDFFLENAGVFEFGTRGVFEPPPWLMFFSRRIGISDSGEIPVLGGLRLTGREGGQTFGLLQMRTSAAFDQRRTDYSVARYKRDFGSGGFVGAMYSHLAESTRPRAESYGADFQYWPTSTTSVQGFVAQVAGGDAAGASSRDRLAHRLLVNREVDRMGVRLERMVFGASSDPPLGFATRTDIQRQDATLRLTFRPRLPGVRRIDSFNFANYIARTGGALQDWGVGPALSFAFNSGEDVTFYHIESHTVLDETFDLADRIPIAVGSFDNAQTGMFLSTSSRRPVSVNGNGQFQHFYGGNLWALNGSLNVAAGSRGTVSLTRVFNEATVPAGHLVTNVSALRLGYAFSTRATMATTVQYDALDHVMRANARLVYTYRPGSELFVVLNGERDDDIVRSRQPRTALVKLTYLARF
jgi:hypothetical protein